MYESITIAIGAIRLPMEISWKKIMRLKNPTSHIGRKTVHRKVVGIL